MECPVCKETCNIPNDTNTRTSGKFAVARSDGKTVCNQCSDVLDWADSCGINDDQKLVEPKTEIKQIKKDQPTSKVSQPASKKITSFVTICCPKCNSQFSDRLCSCGFKNPLYR